MTKVLVVYASKHNATQEIAEHITADLKSCGLDVEIKPVDTVRDIAPYDAVVLGSAVYVGSWMSDAAQFLKNNQDALSQKHVWFFSSGPTGDGDAVELLKGWTCPEALRHNAEHVAPHDIKVFHGKLDADQLSFGEKLILKVVKPPMGDFRDWDAGRTWTNSISQKLASIN